MLNAAVIRHGKAREYISLLLLYRRFSFLPESVFEVTLAVTRGILSCDILRCYSIDTGDVTKLFFIGVTQREIRERDYTNAITNARYTNYTGNNST